MKPSGVDFSSLSLSDLLKAHPLRYPDEAAAQPVRLSPETIPILSTYRPDPKPTNLGFPGFPSFRRGPYAAMYPHQPWTVRQYAGFSTAAASNAFYQRNLAAGQTGLSIAFDLPTHRGFDSDNPSIAGDVGMAGVAIDSLYDFRELLDGIALDKVSVSMTMNGAVIPTLALFIVTAQEAGVETSKLRGTIQNDILKEFLVRNTFIYPIDPSLRIIRDIFSYCAKHMPKFNPISVSGYHIQEAGGSRDLELAYTLANGIEYVRAGLETGLDVDAFAPRLSFFWAVGMDYAMEIAKLRAARVLWSELMSHFSPANPKSLMLRAHCQTSGWSLTAQDVYNNAVRTALEAMAATQGQTQSLHTNAIDEALALPSDFSAKLARDTQLILRDEAGTRRVIDPWGGSHYIETLTDQLAARARSLINEIEALGGMRKALESGLPQERIERISAATQAAIDKGEIKIVGLNDVEGSMDQDAALKVRSIDGSEVRREQVEKLKRLRSERDEAETRSALSRLQTACTSDVNLLEAAIEAARKGATLGEMSSAMASVFGRYRSPVRFLRGIYAQAMTKHPQAMQLKERIAALSQERGRMPRILIAKVGQDGHDRGQKVVASAFADFGFEVIMGELFATPQSVAKRAREENVDVVGVSILSGAHKRLVPDVHAALARDASKGQRPPILVVGGIVPPQDLEALRATGVDAIFAPGSVMVESALSIVDLLLAREGLVQIKPAGRGSAGAGEA